MKTRTVTKKSKLFLHKLKFSSWFSPLLCSLLWLISAFGATASNNSCSQNIITTWVLHGWGGNAAQMFPSDLVKVTVKLEAKANAAKQQKCKDIQIPTHSQGNKNKLQLRQTLVLERNWSLSTNRQTFVSYLWIFATQLTPALFLFLISKSISLENTHGRNRSTQKMYSRDPQLDRAHSSLITYIQV